MRIKDKDLNHGAALLRIVEHKSFKALNGVPQEYGHYKVNADIHIFVKVASAKFDRSSRNYLFSFGAPHISAIARAMNRGKVFMCLVCGRKGICALDKEEIDRLMDKNAASQQWIRVKLPKGGSFHVSGSKGKLTRAVPDNDFPKKVLA